MSENPFIFGRPVSKENFYNRKEEVMAATGFLKKLQSFSVLGERRIGKTSFLQHILSQDVLRKYGIDPEIHIVINFNMSSLHEVTRDEFIGDIVERIEEQTQIEVETENVFDTLKAYIKKLDLNGKNLIIALDEFEVIAPILNDSFSNWLRFIFQEQNVMAITASRETILGLEESGGKGSPLYNIFTNLRLGLFSLTETRNMIAKMFRKGGIELEEEEVIFLADLSGGNPYFIQLIGHYYYEKKRKDKKVILSKFRDEMLDHAKDQFRGYWKHLTEEEKKSLFHLESSKNDQISHNLKLRGFFIEKDQKLKVFSPLFHEFIKMKIHRPQREEILVFISLSILFSAVILEIIVQGFPEIFIQKPDASTQVLSLMIFFIGFVLLFLLFIRVKTIEKLRQIRDSRIFSRKKRFFYVFLILIIVPILYVIGLQDVGWNLLGEAISVAIAYYLLKIPDKGN